MKNLIQNQYPIILSIFLASVSAQATVTEVPICSDQKYNIDIDSTQYDSKQLDDLLNQIENGPIFQKRRQFKYETEIAISFELRPNVQVTNKELGEELLKFGASQGVKLIRCLTGAVALQMFTSTASEAKDCTSEIEAHLKKRYNFTEKESFDTCQSQLHSQVSEFEIPAKPATSVSEIDTESVFELYKIAFSTETRREVLSGSWPHGAPWWGTGTTRYTADVQVDPITCNIISFDETEEGGSYLK